MFTELITQSKRPPVWVVLAVFGPMLLLIRIAHGLLEEVGTDHILAVLDLVADDALYLLDIAIGDLGICILGREFAGGA